MTRFWVGGATGFLGAEVVRQLRARDEDVVAVSRRGGTLGDVRVDAVDVTDAGAVEASARGCTGAFFAVGRVSRDPNDAEALHHAHVTAGQAGLAGLRAAGIRRVVYVSSSGTLAVSRHPDPIPDETHPAPHEIIARWPYYRSKLYAERAALAANAPPEFAVVVVNPSLLLGPGDARGDSTLDVRRFLARRIPALPRGGVAFVDVRDAATGLLQAYEHGRAGERYLLSSANLPLDVFFGKLSRLTGVAIPSLRMPASPTLAVWSQRVFDRALTAFGGSSPVDATSVEMGCYFWYCDSSKARRELGFDPRDPDMTLRDTVEDLLRH